MGSIHFGTCSWKFPSWDKLVYSSEHPENYLQEYAQKYDMVEIDQWFWSLGKERAGLPKASTVIEYDRATDQNFRFVVKCPNALTRPLHDDEPRRNPYFLNGEFLQAFLDSIQPIASKIGLLMFQFGYLNRQMVANRSQFLAMLEAFFASSPSAIPYAIELRNPSWIDGTWFTWLTDHRIAPVLIQGYWMEDINRTIDRYENLIGDTISIRLHGEDRKLIEAQTGGSWNALVNPRERELAEVARSITTLAERGRVVYVQVNNHYEGSAPLTIERLRALF